MGTLKKKFWKCFRKPWGSIYPTEVFMKMVLMLLVMGVKEKGVGGFSNDIGDH
jgi:hypothetical protein